MVSSGFTPTHGGANKPKYEEDHGHDPKEMNCKPYAEEQQNKKKCE
jgi:hypothetical protein